MSEVLVSSMEGIRQLNAIVGNSTSFKEVIGEPLTITGLVIYMNDEGDKIAALDTVEKGVIGGQADQVSKAMEFYHSAFDGPTVEAPVKIQLGIATSKNNREFVTINFMD